MLREATGGVLAGREMRDRYKQNNEPNAATLTYDPWGGVRLDEISDGRRGLKTASPAAPPTDVHQISRFGALSRRLSCGGGKFAMVV